MLFIYLINNSKVQPIDEPNPIDDSPRRDKTGSKNARSARKCLIIFNGTIMKNNFSVSALIVMSAIAGTSAFAATATREQVNTQLIEAVRTGNIVVNDESDRAQNKVNPSQYPAQPVQAGYSREEVNVNLANAIRTGNIVINDESRRALNQINPGQYPSQPAQASATRAQINAQLVEAVRTGNLAANDESGRKLNELNPTRYATN